ncbi:DUF5123 domain-containing protein [Alkalitalea saponilacus]|uniref:Fibronectin type III domain-containing protein n=1 Tax=Alkalitalea saponilacus TaxID=889453 RepID=A0A1T5ERL1_9BACT|nr:DUF5123 domain-containing protein [Alkalitalea saponilacus]ASB48048.1 hypothetical protein CDL62_02250 [Alkalitalea saponilacus]SKB86632.1 Fibronectin type III domain-containing protein [Alkalitalea saponilacus]
MNLNNLIKSITVIFFAGLLLLGVPSCNDYDFSVDESFNRTFRPPLFSAEGIRASSVRLEWEKVRGAKSYLLEVSRDSLEFIDPVQYELPYHQDSITLTGLMTESRYSARIKAFSATGAPESEFHEITFVTLGEQIFEEVIRGFDDLSNSNYLELRWMPGSEVTHIRIEMLEGEPEIINLTEEEIEQGYKLIESLKPATNYLVRILNGESRRGWYSYTTFEAYPEGYRVVNSEEDLKSILDISGEEHLILVLESGAFFDIRRPQLSADIRHLELLANPVKERPVVNLTTLTLHQNTESVTIRNLELFGDSHTSDYIINENKTTNINSIVFDNCYLHTFRGVVRMQNSANTTQLELLKVNNCVVDNIGGFGFVNGSADGGYRFENIEITNSTFSLIIAHFMDIRKPGGSYIIENCTFYDVIGHGRGFLNTAGVDNFPEILEIRNSIFGKFYYVGEYREDESVRSVNPYFPNLFVDGSYALSDFVINPDYPFVGIGEYAKTSEEVFANPKERDFTIIDSAFPGRAASGDPRWR